MEGVSIYYYSYYHQKMVMTATHPISPKEAKIRHMVYRRFGIPVKPKWSIMHPIIT